MRPLRVLLVNPGKFFYPLPPLSLAYLASYASAHSPAGRFTFTICDENSGESADRALRSGTYDVVGLSAVTNQIPRAYEVARLAKSTSRPPLVVLGGVHATVLPTRTLAECLDIDGVIAGEGEQAFLELLDAMSQGASPHELAALTQAAPALSTRGHEGTRAPLMASLDDIPVPDRELLNLDYYRRPRLVIRGVVGRATHLMASRGCPYECSFCSSHAMWGRRVRAASPARVLEEVTAISALGFDGVFFQDDIFSLDKARAAAICEGLLDHGLARKLRWTVQMRPNLIGPEDRPLLKLMRQAGCTQVEYGLESGSQRILNQLKVQSATVEKNSDVVRLTHECGLRVLGTFILGTEGETAADIASTTRFIDSHEDVLDYYQVFLSTPYPGTRLWEVCERTGMLAGKSWDQFAMGVFDDTVFSTTVDHELVRRTLRELTHRSFGRISLAHKLVWLWSRLRDDPRYVWRRVRDVLR
jgi:radical SAM superfamily enzyme YgiQ (UPF0313 family)